LLKHWTFGFWLNRLELRVRIQFCNLQGVPPSFSISWWRIEITKLLE
jgi:hypothetical protein